jgi:hypothetical protein
MPIARWTSSAVTPAPRIRTGSRWTLMRRSRPPITWTWPTPLIVSMRRRTTSSASRVSSAIGRSPLTDSISTGAASGSSFWTCGASTPAGSALRISSIRSRTSWAATSMSLDRSNITTTIETPSVVVDDS